MGTRNLTMVIENEKVKIAQYGQWDGYPGGQGLTALNFLKKFDPIAFGFQLERCKFVDKDKQQEIDFYLMSIGVKDEWMTMDKARLFKSQYPFFSRDNGANILSLVNDSEEETIWLYDDSKFVNDSLMNEWTYVIDMDRKTFEVYTGFTKNPLHKHERFYSEKPNEDGYYPVKNIAIYHFNNLPEEKEFLKLEEIESE